MKKLLMLFCILVFAQNLFSKSSPLKSTIKVSKIQTSPYADYVGKYEMTLKKGTVYIDLAIIDGDLVCTQLWDGEKLLLKHLSGDNFIMAGFDWSVKFLRDKDKKVTEILAMGTDHWMKVKG